MRIAPPSLPPHHSDPVTSDFQSSILRMPDVQRAHETSCFSSQAHTQLSIVCSSASDGQLSGRLGTKLARHNTQCNRMAICMVFVHAFVCHGT